MDVTLFARQALGVHLRLPFADYHRILFRWHAQMRRVSLPTRTGLRYALAAPRGSAKSTIVSFLLVLHDIAYAHERYIIIISATQRQAQLRLRALRRELTEDTALSRWFYPLFGRDHVQSSNNVLMLANGVRIEAFGAGTEMRGITHDSWRPTKIILDDAETSAAATSPRRRAHLNEWFGEVIEHLGNGYTHLLAIGTILHPKSLLSSLLERPDFESLRCRSIETFAPPSPHWDQWRVLLTSPSLKHPREQARSYFLEHRTEMETGTKVLWGAHEDYEQLLAQLVTQGRRAFYQEMQNEPLGPEDALFEPENAWRARRNSNGVEILSPPSTHYAGSPSLREYAFDDLRLFGYHDASMGKGRSTGKGDFAALATVALAPDGTLILLSIWVRRAPPSQQVTTLFETHVVAPFERLAVEGTGFQELLLMPIEAERKRRREQNQRHDLPVEIVKPTKNKQMRIASLEPLITSGRLALCENLPEEFWSELAAYPRVPHDDALDAVAGAVELALNAKIQGTEKKTTTVKRKKRRETF